MSKIKDIYSLTPVQKGMYFHNELDSKDSSYQTQSFFRANQRISEASLRTSLKCLAEKYDVLRTAFAASKATGVVKQIVLDDRAIELRVVRCDEEYNLSTIKAYSSDDLLRGYDLKNDSLMRVAILSFKEASFD